MAAPLGSRPIVFWLNLSAPLRVCSSCARYFSTSYTRKHEAAEQRKTHFGFQTVREEDKEHKVYEVFENVATRYDLMNDVMSGGIHRLWKDYFMRCLCPLPGTKLVDVAGGTGDIAFRFLQYAQTSAHNQIPEMMEENFDIELPHSFEANVFVDMGTDSKLSSSSDKENRHKKSGKETRKETHVTVCDINQAMLDVGKKKAEEMGITSGMSWIQGNAEQLPFDCASFDAYTIAFGIRNCTNVQQVINEAYRVLKPGGRFMCLEFSQVLNPLLRSAYDTYSFNVIPVMGQVIAKDWKSYQYLVESIRQFPNQEEFSDMIREGGFRMVHYKNLTFGVAAIHSGFKIIK